MTTYVIKYISPSFHCNALKDGDRGINDIIEINYSSMRPYQNLKNKIEIFLLSRIGWVGKIWPQGEKLNLKLDYRFWKIESVYKQDLFLS